MQLQFEKQQITCLHTIKRETQNQEQTQELRVSDGMPDIGSVTGTWGQVILRGKEWQSDGLSVTGGTKVWIQYVPEEGGDPQCVQSWLPFQMRWDLPHTQRDGIIQVQCFVRSVDARSTSARKLMVRVNLSVCVWALEEQTSDLFTPGEIPEDVQLRRETYPVQLFTEAGEKAFSIEETLTLPPAAGQMEQPISYQIYPQITEVKMVNDKVVFRGNALLHLYYKTPEGMTCSWDLELPFTQYSELEKEYGEEAGVLLLPCVTALELDMEEDHYQIKAGIVCQYRISERKFVELVTDAYSPHRQVKPVCQELELPGILESRVQTIHPQQNIALSGMRLADVQCLPEPVAVHGAGQEKELEIQGRFQALYYDVEGQLRTAGAHWEQNQILQTGPGTEVDVFLFPNGTVHSSFASGSAQLNAEIAVITETVCGTPLDMLVGLEIGELQARDPKRPSLVLRRVQTGDLWELAKHYGSTVVAIRQANDLQEDPEPGKMILIPLK